MRARHVVLSVFLFHLVLGSQLIYAAEGRIPIAGQFTITAPGRYILTDNITGVPASQNAITIQSNDVDLDLGGFTINSASGGDGVFGVDVKNIAISNGSIVGGVNGIRLYIYSAEAKYVIRNVRITNPSVRGMYLWSDYFVGDDDPVEVIVESNIVVQETPGGNTEGILIFDTRGSVIRDNIITGFSQWGFAINYCSNSLIENNRVTTVNAAGLAYAGITLYESDTNIVRNNIVKGAGDGIRLTGSKANMIASNNTSNNLAAGNGIHLEGASLYNTVDGNMASGHTSGCGIKFESGSTGNVYSNNRTLNNATGICDAGGNTNLGNVWWARGNTGTNPVNDFLGTTDSQPLVLRTANAERMRVDASGNVGIGTNAPSSKVEIQGDNLTMVDTNGDTIKLGEGGGGAGWLDFSWAGGASAVQNLWFAGGDATNSYQMDIFDVNAVTSYFSGDLGVGASAPDAKLQVNGNTHITNGDLGIRTAGAADAPLHVNGDAHIQNGDLIFEQTLDATRVIFNAAGIQFRKDEDDDQSNAWFRFYTREAGLWEQFRIEDGNEAAALFDGAVTANGIDYAEAFKITDPTLEAGDVVALDVLRPEYIERAGLEEDARAIGVVSEKPGFVTGKSFNAEDQADPALTEMRNQARLANDAEAERKYTQQMMDLVDRQYRSVALLGRVPVKVDGSYGSIRAGDRLTASPTPGRATALSGEGQSIGIALQPWTTKTTGKILAFIQPGWQSSNTVAPGNEKKTKAGEKKKPGVTRQDVAGDLEIGLDSERKGDSQLSVFRDGEHKLSDQVMSLDEEGNLLLRGAVMPQSMDVAEYHPVSEEVEPGDVLVVDRVHPGLVRRGSQAADNAVVGIVASSPGVLLGAGLQRLASLAPELWKKIEDAREMGDFDTQKKLLQELRILFRKKYAAVSLAGTVRCKVDASYGMIQPGDLLVTSPTPGYAMRLDNPYAGTVVGKALDTLTSGIGEIRVLVMLR